MNRTFHQDPNLSDGYWLCDENNMPYRWIPRQRTVSEHTLSAAVVLVQALLYLALIFGGGFVFYAGICAVMGVSVF